MSNLPAYVLNKQNSTSGERDVLSRILAFRLVEEDTRSTQVRDVLDFGGRLSTAVVDSASEIQLQLQPNVYPVYIKTGSVRSTDFDRVDDASKRFLFGQGVRGVRNFIEKERLAALRGDATAQQFQGFDEQMLLLVRQMRFCKLKLLAMGPDTYWLDHVFPSLLLLARRNVAVTVVVAPVIKLDPKIQLQERRRRALLELLGAKVTETSERLPFTGFAFDLESSQASTILTFLPENARKYEDEKVRLYTADSDPVILEVVAEQVRAHTQAAAASLLKLEYAPCPEQNLIDRLRRVPAYERASIGMQSIRVTREIIVMQRRIKEFKALQIRSFMSDLADDERSYFSLLQVQLANAKSSTVTPPVLERHSSALVVIEGNSRLHHCFTNGIDEVTAVVIEDVTDPLPSDGRLSLGNLRLVSSTISIPDNYQNYRESAYRHIERAVHETYD